MPAYQLVSIIGSVLLLAAYAGLQLGVLTTESYAYQFANLVGAACLTYSVIEPFNSGVFITESVWTIFSIVGLWRISRTVNGRRRHSGPKATGDAGRPTPPQ